jgi:hypothetical protein
MGAMILGALKARKSGRHWETLVGYSLSDLTTHLERQFLPGMTWLNFGQWHIDHIVPQRCFTFETERDAEFRACWALSNLRPLWAEDNFRKHGRRLYLI